MNSGGRKKSLSKNLSLQEKHDFLGVKDYDDIEVENTAKSFFIYTKQEALGQPRLP